MPENKYSARNKISREDTAVQRNKLTRRDSRESGDINFHSRWIIPQVNRVARVGGLYEKQRRGVV